MEILLVTPFWDRDAGGGPDRVRGLFAGLRANGHNVTVLPLPVTKRITSRRDLPWWYFAPSRDWLSEFRARIARIDLIVGSYLPAAAACVEVLQTMSRHPTFVYAADNDEAGLALQTGSRRQARLVSRMEREVVTHADFVWMAGELDAQRLRSRFPSSKVVNVPNGVLDMPDLSSVPLTRGAAFTYGSWKYGPNVAGLRELARSRTDAAGVFQVFGAVDTRLRSRLNRDARRAQPGVEWRFGGFVPELGDLAGSGAVGLIPLWSGAGTKVRTVQLAAMGVAAIVTPEALAGLPSWLADQLPVETEPARLLEHALSGAVPEIGARRILQERVRAELHWSAIVGAALH